jgi:hypothetical protein
MMNRILLYLCPFVFIGCSEKGADDVEVTGGSSLEISADQKSESDQANMSDRTAASKTENGITYSVDLMNAVDFVSRKGEQIELADRMELMKETVAILTIDLNNSKEIDVFESSKMTMEKEDAMNYLVGSIVSDIEIKQGGKTIAPAGVQYDAGVSKPGKLRVFIYFNNVKINQPSSVVVYDRLFGSGLLRFNIQ